MTLADSNVWLALALSKHTFHRSVQRWLTRQKPGQPVLFCRATQQSLLRLLTTKEVLDLYGIAALNNKSAWSVYEGFLKDQRIGWAEEPRGLEVTWKSLAGHSKPSPKLWMDAYLAAFALSGNFQFVTTDKAFKQFKELDLLILSNI
jgi:toxin-antitoxin system PIN domain toxin